MYIDYLENVTFSKEKQLEDFKKNNDIINAEMEHALNYEFWINDHEHLSEQISTVTRLCEGLYQIGCLSVGYSNQPSFQLLRTFPSVVHTIVSNNNQLVRFINGLSGETVTVPEEEWNDYRSCIDDLLALYRRTSHLGGHFLIDICTGFLQEKHYRIPVVFAVLYTRVTEFYSIIYKTFQDMEKDPRFRKMKLNQGFDEYLRGPWQERQKKILFDFENHKIDPNVVLRRTIDEYNESPWGKAEYRSKDSTLTHVDDDLFSDQLFKLAFNLVDPSGPEHDIAYFFDYQLTIQLLQHLCQNGKAPKRYQPLFLKDTQVSDISPLARQTLVGHFCGGLRRIPGKYLAQGVDINVLLHFVGYLLLFHPGQADAITAYQDYFWQETQKVVSSNPNKKKIVFSSEVGVFNVAPFLTVLGAIAPKDNSGLLVDISQSELVSHYLGERDYTDCDPEIKDAVKTAILNGMKGKGEKLLVAAAIVRNNLQK